MSTTLAPSPPSSRIRQFYALTKPRVVSLIVFTAVIGMLLATPGMVPPVLLIAATVGIALVAGAAAAVNCLVEQKIDALMTRTKYRPLPRGQITTLETLIFSGIVGGIGSHCCITGQCADDVADVGHRRLCCHLYRHPQADDSQNIVIGGASGDAALGRLPSPVMSRLS
jgi:heme O synthase-like polyprenyltransferase